MQIQDQERFRTNFENYGMAWTTNTIKHPCILEVLKRTSKESRKGVKTVCLVEICIFFYLPTNFPLSKSNKYLERIQIQRVPATLA